jgi:hypothetical protein
VKISAVLDHELKKQDCVAVVEFHVLACSNPALDQVAKISAPLEKFPKQKNILTFENFLLTPSQGAHTHPRPWDNPIR